MIPKQTKASIRIIGTIGIYRLFGVLFVYSMGDGIGELIVPNDTLKFLFTAFLCIGYFILTSKTKNPNKYFATELKDYFVFLFSPKVYVNEKSSDNKEVEMTDECEKQLEEIISESEEGEEAANDR